jgi:hypothetical protein
MSYECLGQIQIMYNAQCLDKHLLTPIIQARNVGSGGWVASSKKTIAAVFLENGTFKTLELPSM